MDISEWKVTNKKLSCLLSEFTLPNCLINVVVGYALSLADYLSSELRKRRKLVQSPKFNHVLYELCKFAVGQSILIYGHLRLRNPLLFCELNERPKSSYVCDTNADTSLSLRKTWKSRTDIEKLESKIQTVGFSACWSARIAIKQIQKQRNEPSSILGIKEAIKSIRYSDKCADLLDELDHKMREIKYKTKVLIKKVSREKRKIKRGHVR